MAYSKVDESAAEAKDTSGFDGTANKGVESKAAVCFSLLLLVCRLAMFVGSDQPQVSVQVSAEHPIVTQHGLIVEFCTATVIRRAAR